METNQEFNITKSKDEYGDDLFVVNKKVFKQRDLTPLQLTIRNFSISHKIFDGSKLNNEPSVRIEGEALLENKRLGIAGLDVLNENISVSIEAVDEQDFVEVKCLDSDSGNDLIKANAVIYNLFSSEQRSFLITLKLVQSDLANLCRMLSKRQFSQISICIRLQDLFSDSKDCMIDSCAFMLPNQDKAFGYIEYFYLEETFLESSNYTHSKDKKEYSLNVNQEKVGKAKVLEISKGNYENLVDILDKLTDKESHKNNSTFVSWTALFLAILALIIA